MYKLARAGKISEFTGISDPYEVPKSPDIVVNSDGKKSPSVLVNEIFQKLCNSGLFENLNNKTYLRFFKVMKFIDLDTQQNKIRAKIEKEFCFKPW